MRRLCVVALILLLADIAATAQTFILHDTIRLRDSSSIIPPIEPSDVAKRARGIIDKDNDDEATRRSPFADSITSKGYISQSFASGNRRDLSPNTTADLSVRARLASGVNIAAEVLDSDMPMDDDGVTNQVNELSSVRITASKDSTRLSIGDIVANNNRQTLAKFSKKIKGLEFVTINGKKNGDTIAARTDFAATKGKFRRQQFMGQDNSQGPYYLNAGDSLSSVIVLTGTEKVWLDGRQLVRGEDADYTIDYNSGTITFNIKHIITSQSVVTVDFEYSENLYNNYFIYANAQYQRRGTRYSAGYMSEYDGLGAAADSVAADTSMARPKRNDYAFLGIDAKISHNTKLKAEAMMSKITTDRLNPAATTSRAMAAIAGAEHNFLSGDTSKSFVVKTQWKYLSEGFVPIVTEKNIDFHEKWDLQDYRQGGRELFSTSSAQFKSGKSHAAYTFMTAQIDGQMDGMAHILSAVGKYKNFTNTFATDFYSDQQSERKHDYLSAQLKSEYQRDSLTIGASLLQKSRSSHSPTLPNYRDISTFAIRKIRHGYAGLTLTDRSSFDGFFYDHNNDSATSSTFVKAEFQLDSAEKYSLKVMEIFRKDHGYSNDCYLTGQISGSYQLFDRQIVISASQQSQHGNQEQLAYKYIRTTTGNGHYTWNDYNGDGIEDLNEFEVSYYKTDADYVKYFVHTGKYINTIQNDWSVNLQLRPKRGRRRITAITSRITANAAIDLMRQDARRNGSSFFMGDSLIAKTLRQRYSTRLKIIQNVFAGNSWSSARQERLTYYGREDNTNDASSFFVEYDQEYGFNAKIQRTFKNSHYLSEQFAEKCYRIHAVENQCDLKYDFTNGLSIGLGALHSRKNNRSDTTAARINAVNMSLSFTREGKGSITLSNRIIKNKYDDNSRQGSSSSYQMLEGLNVGVNCVMSASATYMITRYLQLSLLYELRTSPGNTLHTGEMELKAVF